MQLTQEQLILYLKDELHLGNIACSEHPDGVFASIEEKKQIIEYFYEKNNVCNK